MYYPVTRGGNGHCKKTTKTVPLCTLMQIFNKILANTNELNTDRILYNMMK